MKLGETRTARIAPTAADGSAAVVTAVLFTCSDPSAFSVVPGADGLSAVYTALVAGTGRFANVSAVSAGGVALNDSAALPDVEAPVVPEAVRLNLTIS